MSAPRLILKQPTGWFAAGREFAQALTLLSDEAFKLYVYACLRADRHTGRLRATVDELAQAMTRAPTAVAMNLDELEEPAVCGVIRNLSRNPWGSLRLPHIIRTPAHFTVMLAHITGIRTFPHFAAL